MDKYVGVKLIEAEPMSEGTFLQLVGRIYDVESCQKEGYMVVYADGYRSWSPKDVFEQAYLKVEPNPRLKSGVSISQQMVDQFIKEIHTWTISEKTTVVRCILVNGFEIVESSSCVDPVNYDEAIGKEICLKKIEDKVWHLLGFLLQTAVGGVKE